MENSNEVRDAVATDASIAVEAEAQLVSPPDPYHIVVGRGGEEEEADDSRDKEDDVEEKEQEQEGGATPEKDNHLTLMAVGVALQRSATNHEANVGAVMQPNPINNNTPNWRIQQQASEEYPTNINLTSTTLPGNVGDDANNGTTTEKDNALTMGAIGVAMRDSVVVSGASPPGSECSVHLRQAATTTQEEMDPAGADNTDVYDGMADSKKEDALTLGAVRVATRDSEQVPVPGAYAMPSIADPTTSNGDNDDHHDSNDDDHDGLELNIDNGIDNPALVHPGVVHTETADDDDQSHREHPFEVPDTLDANSEESFREHLVPQATRVDDIIVHATSQSRSVEELQEEVARTQRRFRTIVRFFCGICLFSIMLAAVLAPIFVVSDSPKTSSLPTRRPPFSDALSQSSQDDITLDPHSSQALANEWMWDDPYLHEYSWERQLQRFMLVTCWFATGGGTEGSWKNTDHWLSYDVSECDWYTAHPSSEPICEENSVLRIINMTNNGLEGTLPNEALRFATARVVDLSFNKLFGELPPMSKSVASTLEVVDYTDNSFEGQFHVEFGVQAMSLTSFTVRGNQFTGNLPMLPMPNMTYIDISGNGFEGTIPATLGVAFGNVEVVLFGGNKFSGTIPRQVEWLKKLQQVDFSGNTGMHGSLPEELGSIQQLEYANFVDTQISGTIPQSLCEKEQAGLLELIVDCSSKTTQDNADDGITMLQCCPVSR